MMHDVYPGGIPEKLGEGGGLCGEFFETVTQFRPNFAIFPISDPTQHSLCYFRPAPSTGKHTQVY